MKRALPLAAAACLVVAWTTPAQAKPHPKRKPWPVTLTIRTVPPLSGIRFTMDGDSVRTGSHGKATYTREHNFSKHTLALVDRSIKTKDRRYRFARWAGQRDPGQTYLTKITGLPMRADYTITVAFTVQYPVTAHFADQNGLPMELSRISAAQIKSLDGKQSELPRTGRLWLDGKVPVYRKSALSLVDTVYSVQSVMFDGTNVVDVGRQRFKPSAGPDVKVTGYFHDLTVTVQDALFGHPVSGYVIVTRPDGVRRALVVGDDQTAEARRLPRGEYGVGISGSDGIVLSQQIRLSKQKTLDMKVISLKDQIVVAALATMIAVFLLMLGRGRRLVAGLVRKLAYR
jgi:hypothetical protein